MLKTIILKIYSNRIYLRFLEISVEMMLRADLELCILIQIEKPFTCRKFCWILRWIMAKSHPKMYRFASKSNELSKFNEYKC